MGWRGCGGSLRVCWDRSDERLAYRYLRTLRGTVLTVITPRITPQQKHGARCCCHYLPALAIRTAAACCPYTICCACHLLLYLPAAAAHFRPLRFFLYE